MFVVDKRWMNPTRCRTYFVLVNSNFIEWAPKWIDNASEVLILNLVLAAVLQTFPKFISYLLLSVLMLHIPKLLYYKSLQLHAIYYPT